MSSQHGYTVTYTLCAAVMAAAVLVALLVPGRLRRAAAKLPAPASAVE